MRDESWGMEHGRIVVCIDRGVLERLKEVMLKNQAFVDLFV